MAKAHFPKNLKCREINPINKKWLVEFRNVTNFVDSYYATIGNFFRFCEYQEKPFNIFATIPDIEKYVEVMIDNGYTADTINSLIGALSGFKNFLIKNHPNEFPENFLFDINSLRIDDDNPSDAFELNIEQINHIREYNHQKFVYEYIFELYFQLGIRKKDISICHPSNICDELSVFKLADNEIRYNAKIAELLKVYPKDQELKLTPEVANLYFLKVTHYLRQQSVYTKERLLNYSDLIKSHQKYIFTCPSCGEDTENIARNWVLVKRKSDTNYRLVCARCKGITNGNRSYP